MRLIVHILQLLFNQLGVHMCGGYIRMSQHFLYRMDVRTVFQQMRCKGMAQGVGSDILLYACLFLVVLHYFPEALSGHALSADIHKK